MFPNWLRVNPGDLLSLRALRQFQQDGRAFLQRRLKIANRTTKMQLPLKSQR